MIAGYIWFNVDQRFCTAPAEKNIFDKAIVFLTLEGTLRCRGVHYLRK